METHLDADLKDAILKESVNVFKLNNTIINTIDGQALVLTKLVSKYAILVLLFLVICFKIGNLIF